MLNGRHQGQDLGACTDCRRYWTEFRAGAISQQEMLELENSLSSRWTGAATSTSW